MYCMYKHHHKRDDGGYVHCAVYMYMIMVAYLWAFGSFVSEGRWRGAAGVDDGSITGRLVHWKRECFLFCLIRAALEQSRMIHNLTLVTESLVLLLWKQNYMLEHPWFMCSLIMYMNVYNANTCTCHVHLYMYTVHVHCTLHMLCICT